MPSRAISMRGSPGNPRASGEVFVDGGNELALEP
jgi:hypothetical protein